MSNASNSAELTSSSVVDETYRIDSSVAQGGFSKIYRATHMEMNQPVALKVLPIDENVEAAVLERFSQEARLASRVHHPNLVHVFEYGQDPRGFLYIAMEWLDGPSLHDLVEGSGSLEPLRVAETALQICRGLAAAHEQGVLHRDLKPSNVILIEYPAGDEIVKVLDFGIAKALAESSEQQLRITADDMFVGTPRYAAPEQIQGEGLTEATDIYGLGLIMWEALVGESAVSGVDFKECVSQHLSGDPWELPSDVDCPRGLRRVIHRALNKDPENRYESCVEMAADLERIVNELRPNRSFLESVLHAFETSPRWTKLSVGLIVAAGGLFAAMKAFTPPLSGTTTASSTDRVVGTDAETAQPVGDLRDLVPPLEERGWRVEEGETGNGELEELRIERDSTTFVLKPASEASLRDVPHLLRVGGLPISARTEGEDGRAGDDSSIERLLSDLREIDSAGR